jgi:death-on-curing family protein
MNDSGIVYPTVDEMIEFNIMVLNVIKTKKADKSEILSYSKIKDIVEGCKKAQGDIYDKAAYLMKQIVGQHAFASGNRRTAFIVTKFFLSANHEPFTISDNPDYARIMVGIREKYYTDAEIKNWIKNGTIREFKRH